MTGVVFHPKVFDFSGPTCSLSVVGSSNLTTGGLYSNIEASLIAECDQGEPNPVDALFEWLRPVPPFTADHVRKVSADLLLEIAPSLDRYTKKSPDWTERAVTGNPLDPDFVFPVIGRPPSPSTQPEKGKRNGVGRRNRPIHTDAVAATSLDVLFVELWDETGGGTQVQIPKKAFVDYFGADPSAVTWITLDTPSGSLGPIRIQYFSNSTYRISLPFVGNSPQRAGRRAVLRFIRKAPDQYEVGIRFKGGREYGTWLSRCTLQSYASSKRYGIEVEVQSHI
jgi:hypothetical protein